ncbi:MAG: CTP synthase [Candidatus Aenigmarchaeota archaeon]|nr:CTP synthase [Candidatus Aenigmarchaeota archaeon]
MTNYIFVTGGVVSGLGKGITTASLGRVLKSKGFSVTAVKIDPYINVDAGTLRPTEHGEVWVTEDGGEIDQDLGHYERFLDITISKEHNITTGQVYREVIEKERRGDFLGKTVEVIPHIPDEIKRRIRNAAEKTKADFVLVEIGGVVGDYQNILFLEAARQIKFDGDNAIFIHVGFLPVLRHLGEMKSKPLQHSVRALMQTGIIPDFIVCRSEQPVDDVRKEKIAMFCNVHDKDIISNPDVENVYELPLIFEEQKFGEKILEKLNISAKGSDMKEWRAAVAKMNNASGIVKIGIVGKYFDIGSFKLADSYISVIEAVRHAAAWSGVKPEIVWIDSKGFEKNPGKLGDLNNLDGIIVPGGFGSTGIEGKIAAIKYARENNIPFLGLCYGLQLAVIEFARNVCGLKGANSTEIDPNTQYPVIDILPEQKKIIEGKNYGATMRLGGQQVLIKNGTLASRLYGKDRVTERFRHRYEISPQYVETLEKNGFVMSGSTPDGRIKQIGELPKLKFFLGTQFHPEFTSRLTEPNPLFAGFIKACMETQF